MKIDLTDFFNGSVGRKEINYSVDLSSFAYAGYFPVKDEVTVEGFISSKADIVSLSLDISYCFYGICDRCAEDLKKVFNIKIEKIIVKALQNEEDDEDYIVASDNILDIDELVSEEVSLNIPSKLLCKETCKGLCPKCGTNLNVNKCDCKADVDPRMAALLQLLDE